MRIEVSPGGVNAVARGMACVGVERCLAELNIGIVHRSCRGNFYRRLYICTDNSLDYYHNVK